jgi:uncharacterized protein (TIRG00374 family)
MKRLLTVLVGLALILVLVAVADPAKVLEAFAKIHLLLIFAAILVYLLSWALRTFRLQVMIHLLREGESPGILAAFKSYIAAFAINNIFPLKVGDAAMVGFLEMHGVAASKGAAIVIKGRVLDVLAMISLMIPPFLIYGLDKEYVIPVASSAVATLTLVSILVLMIVLMRASMIQKLLDRLKQAVHNKRLAQVVDIIKDMPGHFMEMLKTPVIMLILLVLSFGIWMCEGAVYYIVLQGMSVDVSLSPAMAAVMVANLGKGVPGIPGGVGVYEGIAAGFAASFGVPLQTGLAAAIIDHLLKKSVNLGIGLPAALAMGFKFTGKDNEKG